jgi:hypothetical protein
MTLLSAEALFDRGSRGAGLGPEVAWPHASVEPASGRQPAVPAVNLASTRGPTDNLAVVYAGPTLNSLDAPVRT